MTNTGDNAIHEKERALEELLGQATPRPVPPEDVMRKAKLAVQSDWQQLTRQRRTHRRLTLLAAAATFVFAIALVMHAVLAPIEQPVQVATLDKAIGTVYLLGEQSELNPVVDVEVIRSGETIKTVRDAHVGLSWGSGGSLRLDENTEVRFAAADRIELHSGRVYFDSLPDSGLPARLTIETSRGNVTHIGTQFITAIDDTSLTVSVREGRVSIDGHYRDAVVNAGKQARLVGSTSPEVLDIKGYGDEWRWVELSAPVRITSGQKLTDLLAWFVRETGYKYDFESEDVEALVEEGDVQGDISDTPREALRTSLLVNELDYDIDEENGVIIISQAGR